MSPLQSLPVDCWYMVFEYLSKSDIKNLCLVSRGLQASTAPFLYREIKQDWLRCHFKRLLQLLRTIHSRPERATLIRSVVFEMDAHMVTFPRPNSCMCAWKANINSKLVSPKGEYGVVRKFCLSIVQDAKIPQQDVWKKGLKDGNPYVYAALLISQLPNIWSLRLDDNFLNQGGFPALVIRHALLSGSPGVISEFDRLAFIRYGHNNMALDEILHSNTERFVGIFSFVPLLYLERGAPWQVRLATSTSSICESGGGQRPSNHRSCVILGFLETLSVLKSQGLMEFEHWGAVIEEIREHARLGTLVDEKRPFEHIRFRLVFSAHPALETDGGI